MRIKKSIHAKFSVLFIGILLLTCLFAFVLGDLLKHVFYQMHIDVNPQMIVCVLCLLIGSVLMAYAARKITKPIKNMSETTKKIAQGDFDVEVSYESEDEIGELAKNFNRMTLELQQNEYLKKDFMNNVAHEFKTPLASIQGFVELLRDPLLPKDKVETYTTIILEEVERLNHLSSNMLRLSRLDHQVIGNKETIFSLDEQIRRVILLFNNQWANKKMVLDLNLEKVDYQGDEELLLQIWINLIGNAIKFSKEHKTLTVNLQKQKEYVVVEVIDEGIGIKEDAIKRIFETFYQEDRAHFAGGNGLGLAIVKRILELCEGDIEVESTKGKGTKFTVRLPIKGVYKTNRSKRN